ncbi:MAG: hypothetical protein ACYDBB_13210 [Armatimonadota bacterium]
MLMPFVRIIHNISNNGQLALGDSRPDGGESQAVLYFMNNPG